METAPLFAQIACGPEGGKAWWVKAEDGIRIRFGHWPAPPDSRGTVFLLPGRTEYVEKYGPAAADFAARGYAMLAIDWRGQGIADRLSSDRPMMGRVGRFLDYQLDLRAITAAARELDLPRPWFLLGHSMGGAIGLRALMSRAHPFAAAAFSAPMWGIRLPALVQPFRVILARLLGDSFLGTHYPPGMSEVSYVHRANFETNQLTRDPAMWAFLVAQAAAHPELTLGGASYRWACESVLECEALAAMPSPDLPCYCAVGAEEKIIALPPVHDRMNRWARGRLEVIAHAEHELMMEVPATRARLYDACADLFIKAAENT